MRSFGLRAALVAAMVLGVASGAAYAVPPTTEQSTIGGDASAAYSGLTTTAGWPRVVRTELAGAQADREKRRRSLTYFAQLTDFQLADEESPKRVEFLDIAGTPFTAAWRPQEALEPFIADQAIRQVDTFSAASPVTGKGNARARMDLALTTGDSADNKQRNEVNWVVKLLEGGTLNPNSGVESLCPSGLLTPGEAARYTGVQDYDDYQATDAFYDPDVPTGRWAAWPRYPGLMDRAQQPFSAAGLNVPSYVAFGNHDGLTQGNAAENAGYEAIATGCVKPFAPVPLADLQPAFLATTSQQVAAVPPDPNRQTVSDEQYRALHATGQQADAHGFAHIDPAEEQARRRLDQLLLVLAEAGRSPDLDRHGRRGRHPGPGRGRQHRRSAVPVDRASAPGRRCGPRARDPLRAPPDPLADDGPARRDRAAVHDRRPPRPRREPRLRRRSA